MKDLFDSYSRQARLQPALLTLLPLFILIIVWAPTVYGLATAILGLLITCGVTGFLAHFARTRGRAAEKRLFNAWGGKPTTLWLRHSGDDIDPHTRARYHTFLQSHVTGWTAPTLEDERRDIAAADTRYDSGVKWLLEYTRNTEKFPLVFKESTLYGFRRNLYGLKPLGLLITILCTIANIAALCVAYDKASALVQLSSLAVSVVYIFVWTLTVQPRWVKDAANAYARALLSCCEGL